MTEIEKLDINERTGRKIEKANIVLDQIARIEESVDVLLNRQIDLKGAMSAPEHIKMPKSDMGVQLNLSTQLNKLIWEGFNEFSIVDEVAGYIGDKPPKGSSNVVPEVLEHDLNVFQVMAILLENGQLEAAINEIDRKKADSDPNDNVLILGYVFLKFSLGWIAEKVIFANGGKGSHSHDEGGIDGYYNGETIQVKPITEVGSKGAVFGDKEHTHMFYMWGCDGTMRLTTNENAYEMRDQVAEEVNPDANVTPFARAHRSEDNGFERDVRYFWY